VGVWQLWDDGQVAGIMPQTVSGTWVGSVSVVQQHCLADKGHCACCWADPILMQMR
jgi:hypothetical protein